MWLADAELRDDVNDDIKELGWDGEKDFLSFCGPSLNENVVICEIFRSEAIQIVYTSDCNKIIL